MLEKRKLIELNDRMLKFAPVSLFCLLAPILCEFDIFTQMVHYFPEAPSSWSPWNAHTL
jgi:hypothetical protein